MRERGDRVEGEAEHPAQRVLGLLGERLVAQPNVIKLARAHRALLRDDNVGETALDHAAERLAERQPERLIRIHAELALDRITPVLAGWLRTKPGPELVATWKDYVRGLATPLDLEARRELERHVMDKARQVADAAGGFLGLTSRISAAEREMLSDLSAAFHQETLDLALPQPR